MNRATTIAIAVVGLTTVLSGCAFTLNKQDLIKTDAVEIEATPVIGATYVFVNVYQDGLKLNITGRVALESAKVVAEKPGHIDITARAANGKILMISHSPYVQHQHTGQRNQVDFYTAARLQIPEGSIVIFEHHWAKIGVHDPSDYAW